MNCISEDELFLILTKDGRCPKLNGAEQLEKEDLGGCMMACESEPGYHKTGPLSNRQLKLEVDALNDSMIDAHILKGDFLKVRTHLTVREGDIVLAVVNGESVVRAYYCDEDGDEWLVPRNVNYEPVLMTVENRAEIVGKVVNMKRYELFAKNKDLAKTVEKAKKNKKKPKTVSIQHAMWVIAKIAPQIKVARLWFAVYRPLVQRSVVANKDYDYFCNLVKQVVPNHDKLPIGEEIRRKDDDCFRWDVEKWTPLSAPVKGATYYKYKRLADYALELLDNDEED